ncbi:MAG: regulatory protein GemA [Proteobacteria bacterium]|nr:regulatory protein GemA [Pseudomonadota bacterium]MBS0464630.1 regulatory protein GemA [Pseudomonadota bacterium]
MTTPRDQRKRVLAAIHASAHRLGLDDATYRSLVERVSGEHGPAQRSAGDCTQAQMNAVANELRRLGGLPARGWAGKPRGELAPQLGKIEALLADAGREWAYAHALARRMCRVGRLEWCRPDQLGKIIAAMQIDANRRRAKAGDA